MQNKLSIYLMITEKSGSFRPILGVGHFGLGRWVILANFEVGCFGPELFRPVNMNFKNSWSFGLMTIFLSCKSITAS